MTMVLKDRSSCEQRKNAANPVYPKRLTQSKLNGPEIAPLKTLLSPGILKQDVFHLDVVVILILGCDFGFGCRFVGWCRHVLISNHTLVFRLERPMIRKSSRSVNDGNLVQALSNESLGLRDSRAQCLDGPVHVDGEALSKLIEKLVFRPASGLVIHLLGFARSLGRALLFDISESSSGNDSSEIRTKKVSQPLGSVMPLGGRRSRTCTVCLGAVCFWPRAARAKSVSGFSKGVATTSRLTVATIVVCSELSS